MQKILYENKLLLYIPLFLKINATSVLFLLPPEQITLNFSSLFESVVEKSLHTFHKISEILKMSTFNLSISGNTFASMPAWYKLLAFHVPTTAMGEG